MAVLFKKLLLSIFTILLFSSFSYADDFEKDLKLSELGNPGAMFRIGSLYLNGNSRLGIEVDYEKAKLYLLSAAEKNHPNALYSLGYMHLYGLGYERDYSKAHSYFEKASKLDFAPAYHILCVLYYDGIGVEKNMKKAYNLCSKAAELGYNLKNIALDHMNKAIIVKSK